MTNQKISDRDALRRAVAILLEQADNVPFEDDHQEIRRLADEVSVIAEDLDAEAKAGARP